MKKGYGRGGVPISRFCIECVWEEEDGDGDGDVGMWGCKEGKTQ